MNVVVALTIIMKEIRTLYYFQLVNIFFVCFLFFRKNVNAHFLTYITMSGREKIINFTYHQVVTKLDEMFKVI